MTTAVRLHRSHDSLSVDRSSAVLRPVRLEARCDPNPPHLGVPYTSLGGLGGEGPEEEPGICMEFDVPLCKYKSV